MARIALVDSFVAVSMDKRTATEDEVASHPPLIAARDDIMLMLPFSLLSAAFSSATWSDVEFTVALMFCAFEGHGNEMMVGR